MALIKIAIFILIYCLKTVYSILNCIPIVSTFLEVFERVFFLYLWSLLLVCRIVRNAGRFCFGVTRWCVFLTFLPIYIPGWIASRLLHAVCSKVVGDSTQGKASNGSVLSVLRLIVLCLPVIGSMFASAECRVLYLLKVPVSTVRAMQDNVIAVKTDVYAMLDQVDQISITKIIVGCLSTQRAQATSPISTRRKEMPTGDVHILSANANETSALRPFKRFLLVLPFGKDIIDFIETVFGLPSVCITRCEDVVRNTVETIETIHWFPQEVISSINDLNERFDNLKMESDNAKQPRRFGQLKDDVAKHCNQISQIQRDLAYRFVKQDKDHELSLVKLRRELDALQLMTQNDISEILRKVDEVVEKFELVAKHLTVAECSNGQKVTLPNPEASSTAEVPLHSELQMKAVKRHQVNQSSSFS